MLWNEVQPGLGHLEVQRVALLQLVKLSAPNESCPPSPDVTIRYLNQTHAHTNKRVILPGSFED